MPCFFTQRKSQHLIKKGSMTISDEIQRIYVINTFEVDLYFLCLSLLFALEEPIKKDQCELISLTALVTGVRADWHRLHLNVL